MKRKIVSEVMTTYFPTLLLTAITFATTFFKPFFFEAALSVNLTTMLVMTTIFISKMESLPHTSDIKMIDIWLVLCQMVPFAEVILLTGMEYQRTDDSNWKEGNAEGSLFLKSGPCIWALTVWEGREGVKTHIAHLTGGGGGVKSYLGYAQLHEPFSRKVFRYKFKTITQRN